ncbi:hypothetical protein [Streptomyces fructofermentans]|uniref:Uncharacterized protein n=1 Tax=Streptomyces fructofermentans TaxID=152141 RepID=A0A918NGI1_9ACTN|nr:hypothetical protein [Streptomyces fructofermentans]GGX65352.1 hypothetical protein GCM10010515_36260 [Streptomyces fructofermentans]
MTDQGTPVPVDGFRAVAIDADWPESRQFMGSGYNRVTGDIHVHLWFGSASHDPEVEHVIVFSASSGNAKAREALEDALEDYCYPDEGLPAGLPASEPVTVTADGEPVTFELWRNSSTPYWVARGRVGSTEVVLSGSGTEPGELRLVRVNDLSAYSAPIASLPAREAISVAMGSDLQATPSRQLQVEEADTALRTLRDIAARNAALGGPGRELHGEEADTTMRALRHIAQNAGPAGQLGAES